MKEGFLWLGLQERELWHQWFDRLPLEKRDIYYHPEYVALYENDQSKARCFIYVKEEHIYFYPFLMNRIEQKPGYWDMTTPYGYGGPVMTTGEPGFLKEAYHCFCEQALQRNVVAEVVKFHPLLANHEPLKGIYAGDLIKNRLTVYMDLNVDDEYRWQHIYSRINRQEINKAKRMNVEVQMLQSKEAWEAFQHLYEKNMKFISADEFYLFPPKYYQDIQQKLANYYVLVTCLYEKKIISVLILFFGGVFTHCHLIGTDRDFVSKDVNKLLYHEAISWSRRKGYKTMHIGGGRTPEKEDSLLKFKQNFSDKTAEFYIGENVFNHDVYNELCQKRRSQNPNQPEDPRLLKYRFSL